MAVIGARPASGFGLLGRRVRSRTRPRPPARGRVRAAAGAGRQRREMTSISTFLLVIAAAAGLALFHLSQSSHVAATGYQIEALQAGLADARARQQQLIFEIGRARSPAVIEERARVQLRLVPIEQDQIRFATESTDNH
jgi:cell division protein FtsB